MSDRNAKVIEEFRSNAGKVGGFFENIPLLLLHHTGAKSGITRVAPLAYQPLDDGNVAIFASKGGAPSHPHWYLNIEANPQVEVEVGTEKFAAHARTVMGDERDAIWSRQKEALSFFADYEAKADREIPVVVLERIQS
ncbi:MAG: nitroreductase family deazaflavin-dependent oxidoreductase [Acidimicrobiia bacterium]|nr:nitroreductase family deazaflavin-dependent oxidoreductase [Acidimicrobiia bacterium]